MDSESPTVALYKAGSISLNSYMKVAKRNESVGVVNKAGAKVSMVWREGTGEKGALASCEAFGLLSDNYWMITWRGDGALSAAEQKAIENLISSMSVESTP